MDNEMMENENIHSEPSENGLREAIDDVVRNNDEFGDWEDLNNEFARKHAESTRRYQRISDVIQQTKMTETTGRN